MIETKLSLFSLQEELETQQATVTSENSELFFEAGNCSGHIFEETVPEEYLTKISCRFFRKAEMSPVSILLFSIETGGLIRLLIAPYNAAS